ncbi:MAG: hypothetical protein J6Y94_02420, partial [Bacteriovoracaceae bacterium]|nr:hypothetical protein [Bacteriovoracaceae bacterium]
NAKYEKELAYQTSLQKENDAYRDKMNALGQELSKKQDALAAEKNQQVQLTAQLSAAHAANEKMQQENSLYAQRVAQLDQDLKKALAQIDQSKDQAGHAANLQAKLAAEKVYSEKIGQLNQKLKDELLAMKGEKNKLLQDRAALAQEVNSQRQKVAKRIKENFAKAKLKVQVDELTGEIYLDFSKNYFDYDSTRLTPGMIRILKQAIPVYAKSLFADPELAAKIKSVEIVGHASPTYQGKFVDPRSTSYQARKALNYNMDLSYRRSKEMFNYIFDQQKMKFAYQDRMFAKAKVAGRSYLNVKPPKPKGRIPASFKRKDFCTYYDCSDSQKVAITFELAE